MTTEATTMKVEQIDVELLRIDPGNPRKISDAEVEALRRSLSEWGFVQPLVVNKADYVVAGGNQKLLLARRLGWKTLPCVFVDLTKDEARLLSLALNRIGGAWDDELLARLLSDLQAVDGIDVTLSGFPKDDVAALLKTLDRREKRTRSETFDLDAALEATRASARAQLGQRWELGPHRLEVGDSTDTRVVSRLLGDARAAISFLDPPYGVHLGSHGGQQRGQRRRRIANDALPPEQWKAFCEGWIKNLVERVDGAIYCCMSSKELPLVSQLFEDAGAHWSDYIIWHKDRFVLGRAPYQRAFEPIWFGWPAGVKAHWCGDRNQSDVWEIDRPTESPLHPTMKPLKLVERAINNSSKPGDIVLDLFLGSGTTLIAAERTGRICYGVELDAHFASVVIARWEAFTGETARCVE